MKKVLIIAVAIILILSGTAITALYYIGDKMINAVLDDEISALLEEPSTALQPGQNPGASDNASAIDTSEDSAPEAPQDSTASKDRPQLPSVTKDNKGGSDAKNSGNKIQYTVEQMNKIKDKVTAADKISSAALLVKRLTPADIQELKNMLAGGISAAEKKRAKEIMHQRFTKDEIAYIQDMYDRYMDK
jgi:hypothetical protein